jgi:uncharacterized protein YecE (DUF72 family)
VTRVERCGLSRAQAQTCKHFCLVEAQRSFHKTPRSETYQRWCDEAPADFEFTLKAWQLITHKPTSLTYLARPSCKWIDRRGAAQGPGPALTC